MAEDLNDAVADLTVSDVANFFSEKRVKFDCTQCSEIIPALAFDRQGRTPATVSFDQRDPRTDGALVSFVVQVICKNCGHIRSFEKEVIARWKLGKSPDASP